MKRGVIARIDGTLGRIGSFSETRTEDGRELVNLLSVTGVKRTPGGLDITQGQAASQTLVENDTVTLTNGEIDVSTSATVETDLTDFLTVGDEFVVVDSSAGTFAFDLLEREYNTPVTRADIDLDSFWVSLSNATPWKVGFYGHDGPVENGVVQGESVLDDGVFGSAISDLRKNQLGVKVELDGKEHKFVLTKSGYLELYRPREIESDGFAEFISNKVLSHLA